MHGGSLWLQRGCLRRSIRSASADISLTLVHLFQYEFADEFQEHAVLSFIWGYGSRKQCPSGYYRGKSAIRCDAELSRLSMQSHAMVLCQTKIVRCACRGLSSQRSRKRYRLQLRARSSLNTAGRLLLPHFRHLPTQLGHLAFKCHAAQSSLPVLMVPHLLQTQSLKLLSRAVQQPLHGLLIFKG